MGIKLIKFIDKYIGSVLCLILAAIKAFLPRHDDIKIKNILVLQFWGIGETILTLPAIKVLRDKFPKAEIAILATGRNRDVYSGLSFFDRLLLINLNPFSIKLFMLKNIRKYGLVVDFEEYLNISSIMAFFIGKRRIGFSHGIRSLLYTDKVKYNDKQHVTQTHLDLLKPLGIIKKADKLEKLFINKKDKKIIDDFITKNNLKNKKLIGIAPGAAESARSRIWPRDNFAELADKLIEKYKNSKIIFIGSKEEYNLINDVISLTKNKEKTINAAGKITLKQTFYLISKCSLFISNDTGSMHIAAAMGIKTIGLFGPNVPVRWAPFGKGNVSVYKGNICKYSPCINVHKGEVPECRFGEDNKCMKAISVDDVLGAVTK